MKNSHSSSRLANSKGQALVEYVLMLVISVSLVLMLVYQIFTPMQTYLSNYMGKYIQCLLEMGELPSLGTENSPVKDEGGDCDARFDAASLGAGRPPASRGSSRESSEKSSSSSSSASSGSGTYAGSSSRNGGRSFLNTRGGASKGTSGSAAASGKVVEINLDQSGGTFFGDRSSRSAGRRPARKTSYVAISGLTEAEKKKLQKKADGSGNVMVVSEGIKPPAKKMRVNPPAPAVIEAEEEPMTFGNFIRILFIAAIIIALVVLIGGQALQMSKSFEK